MRGGDISTGKKNGLLTEGSSAALPSISNAGMAEAATVWSRRRMVLPCGVEGETAFPHHSNLLIFIQAHMFSHATLRRTIADEPLRFPKSSWFSPWASKAGKTRMGRFVNQRRDNTLHHVSQHSEGRDHDEIDEAWNQRQRRILEFIMSGVLRILFFFSL